MINKKTFLNYKIKIQIKATTITALKNELKHYPVSEGKGFLIKFLCWSGCLKFR